MMARALLDTLKTLNVEVRIESDKLKWKAPKGVMDDSLKAQMKNHKAELLTLLRDKQADGYHQDGGSKSSREEIYLGDSASEDTDKQFPLNTVILGDCMKRLKTIPDNSIDLIVTDPPYGIKFMGKKWDKAIPSVNIWKECLRVLKPGAFAFIMSAPRQDQLSRIIKNLEDAGFNTGFSSMYWTYASGFPKARNISKAIDKKLVAERKIIGRNPNSRESCDKSNTIYESGTVGKTAYHTEPATEEAKKNDGSYAGFQPKPAVEVIIVAMKPCAQKTYTDQALFNGKGVTWFDECRIPYADDSERPPEFANYPDMRGDNYGQGKKAYTNKIKYKTNQKGRFPANFLISDNVLDDVKKHPRGFLPHKGGNGGYSRFFSLDAWADLNLQDLPERVEQNLPFLIVPKASKKEKDAGLVDRKEEPIKGRDQGQDSRNVAFKARPTPRKNSHPTVKSIKLMAYLITMGSRENDIVLDPFVGSGSTCIAAKLMNRNYIGIEISSEYREIAVLRIENADKDNAIIKLIQESFNRVKDVKPEKNNNTPAQEKLETHSVCSKDAELRLNVLP